MTNSFFPKHLFILLIFAGLSSWVMGQKECCTDGRNRCTASFFDSTFEKALYKGSLDISKHHLTGLFFLKRISENDVRIVFSNEVGMTFFDLEIRNDSLVVHSCFPSLNRRSLLKLLKNDFRLLLIPDKAVRRTNCRMSKDSTLLNCKVKSDRGSFHYFLDKNSGKLQRLKSSNSIMGKTEITVNGLTPSQPKEILISNPTIGLHIRMKLLSR
jgi:hypothetical protein